MQFWFAQWLLMTHVQVVRYGSHDHQANSCLKSLSCGYGGPVWPQRLLLAMHFHDKQDAGAPEYFGRQAFIAFVSYHQKEA
jgi:hypothetical protein